jgi:flagellar FliL protein
MADEDKKKEEGTEDKPAKKSSLRWILVTGAAVLLGIGGYAGWSLFGPGSSREAVPVSSGTPAQAAKKTEPSKIICPLDSFVVNLVDKSNIAKRYLKVTMALEVGDEEAKAKVEKYKTQLRDAIILLLSSQAFQDISSMEGKLALKQEIMNRVNLVLGPGAVSRIYFTEFVVQ